MPLQCCLIRSLLLACASPRVQTLPNMLNDLAILAVAFVVLVGLAAGLALRWLARRSRQRFVAIRELVR